MSEKIRIGDDGKASAPDHCTGGPVTGDMITADVLDKYPVVFEIFMKYGMLCMDCISSSEETLEESCRVHCMDPDDVIGYINKVIAETGQEDCLA